MASLPDNPLLQLVNQGRIRTPAELKVAYHRIVMRTHPDAVGSNRHLERFLRLSSNYQEAEALLAGLDIPDHAPRPAREPNHRLEFFMCLNQIETMEAPYAFHGSEHALALLRAKQAAVSEIRSWNPAWAELYRKAEGEYAAIKKERPSGPYLKDALALNVRPLIYNLIAFHLTGRSLYAKQAKQNLSGIMHRMGQKGCLSLRELLSDLLEDMEAGPAVLDESCAAG